MNDIYELSAKAIVGEDLTDDEKKTLREYNVKYKLVRHLVIEHRRNQGFEIADFQFSPGDEFMKASTLDIANEIIKSFAAPSRSFRFGDSNFIFTDDGTPIKRGTYGNPPVAEKPKRPIIDD